MGRMAAGAYIKELREAKKWSRARVVQELRTYALAGDTDTSESQLLRIERGEQETRGTLLVALVRALKGSLDHLADLLLDSDATVADGERVAQLWLEEQSSKMQVMPEDSRHQATYVYRRIADLLEEGRAPQDALRIVESEIARGVAGDL